MNILLVMDVYIFGGVEKMLKEVSDQLIADGHSVELLLIYKSASNTYLDKLNPKIRIQYIWDIDSKPAIVKRLAFWTNILFPKAVVSKIDTAKYDWVINFKDDYQTNLLSAELDCKKIAWVHNITEDYQRISRQSIKYAVADVIYQKVNKRYLDSFSCFDEVVCVSEHARAALESRCGHPIRSKVIYNYIDTLRIQELAKEAIPERFPAAYLFSYIGRLSAEKGIVEIVQAVCSLLKKGYDTGLVVIGEGYQLAELQEIAQRSGHGESIWFLGTKDNPYPYIANSDCVLCASHKESFGLVVLESILLNRWVISTCCGGPEELIDDGVNGTLVSNYEGLETTMEAQIKKKLVPKESEIVSIQELRPQFYEHLNQILYKGNRT